MSESLNSLQKVKVGISKEDLIGGVVHGQSAGPFQLGFDNGTDIASIHANSADICCVTPVGPVQPSGKKKKKEDRKEENRRDGENPNRGLESKLYLSFQQVANS